MEPYIKNLSDITYMSELTPLFWQRIGLINFFAKRAELIRALTYSPPTADRKLSAH